VRHVLHGERKFLQCSWIERRGWRRDARGGGEGRSVGHVSMGAVVGMGMGQQREAEGGGEVAALCMG
jgi:hypothetical protein